MRGNHLTFDGVGMIFCGLDFSLTLLIVQVFFVQKSSVGFFPMTPAPSHQRLNGMPFATSFYMFIWHTRWEVANVELDLSSIWDLL